MGNLTQNKAERVWLAPMSGSTDAAFRRQVVKFGCEAVVSEMVAGEALTQKRPDVVRRTCRHEGAGRWIVQLAARDPMHMRAASELLADIGVDLIDINMGCPSRQVTGGRSGSALMREPELALQLIDAALEGGRGIPVSLKIRLGWDDELLNAPYLAVEAEKRGICHITVHGRTRCQFYKGTANWAAIKDTVEAVRIPVIANGDITSLETARCALEQSAAYGVMIGRGAMGQPWLPAQISAGLDGRPYRMPSLSEQAESLKDQIEDSLSLYGEHLGLRMVRKHIAAAIEKLAVPYHDTERRALRSKLCQIEDSTSLIKAVDSVYYQQDLGVAA